MKRIVIVYVLMSTLLLGCTEEKNTDTDLDWKVYRHAVSVADYVSAASAMNRVLVKDSTQLNAYDSLGLMYLNLGMHTSAVLIAGKGLKKIETNTLLEVSAAGYKNLGDIESALENYLRLLEIDPENIGYLYEAAYAYIQLQQYEQATNFVNRLIAHPDSDTKLMTEFVNKTGQNIPFKAVGLNMQGFIQMKNGDNRSAIKSYQEAVKLVPDYQLALNNLKFLTTKVESEK